MGRLTFDELLRESSFDIKSDIIDEVFEGVNDNEFLYNKGFKKPKKRHKGKLPDNESDFEGEFEEGSLDGIELSPISGNPTDGKRIEATSVSRGSFTGANGKPCQTAERLDTFLIETKEICDGQPQPKKVVIVLEQGGTPVGVTVGATGGGTGGTVGVTASDSIYKVVVISIGTRFTYEFRAQFQVLLIRCADGRIQATYHYIDSGWGLVGEKSPVICSTDTIIDSIDNDAAAQRIADSTGYDRSHAGLGLQDFM